MGKYDDAQNILKELRGMCFEDLDAAFGYCTMEIIINSFTLDEIEKRINAVKEKRMDICIGDEVEYTSDDGTVNTFVVMAEDTDDNDRKIIGGISTSNFSVENGWDKTYKTNARKTEKHYNVYFIMEMIMEDMMKQSEEEDFASALKKLDVDFA